MSCMLKKECFFWANVRHVFAPRPPGGDGQHAHGVVTAQQTGQLHQPDSGSPRARGGWGWRAEGHRHGNSME